MRYLLITYLRKADGKIDEQVAVSTKVKNSDLQTCNIIMDFKDKVVQKATIEGHPVPADWDNFYKYYQSFYPAIIERLELEAGQE
jgi:hypothetical protein